MSLAKTKMDSGHTAEALYPALTNGQPTQFLYPTSFTASRNAQYVRDYAQKSRALAEAGGQFDPSSWLSVLLQIEVC